MACVVAALAPIPCLSAQDVEERGLWVGGLLFGDAYHVVTHHSDDGAGATGLVLRRGYLTFDTEIGRRWFGRLRFELNQSGEFETYTFVVDVKDLYAGLRAGRHRVLVGLAPTPTFDLIESIWGLRYLARTPMDLQGVASRDAGISASGPLGASGAFGYRAMVGAGLELGRASGDGRKVMGALTWHPSSRWTLDLYLDYEILSGPTDRATLQGFVGYRSDDWRWGVQYSHQDRQDDPRLELASAFAVRRLGKTVSLVGRIDRMIEPSPRGDDIAYLPFDPSAPATTFIGGMELRVAPYLVVTPNTVVTVYDRSGQGTTPETDWHLRLTLFLDLERSLKLIGSPSR